MYFIHMVKYNSQGLMLLVFFLLRNFPRRENLRSLADSLSVWPDLSEPPYEYALLKSLKAHNL